MSISLDQSGLTLPSYSLPDDCSDRLASISLTKPFLEVSGTTTLGNFKVGEIRICTQNGSSNNTYLPTPGSYFMSRIRGARDTARDYTYADTSRLSGGSSFSSWDGSNNLNMLAIIVRVS